jgi:hypothetical protein
VAKGEAVTPQFTFRVLASEFVFTFMFATPTPNSNLNTKPEHRTLKLERQVAL